MSEDGKKQLAVTNKQGALIGNKPQISSSGTVNQYTEKQEVDVGFVVDTTGSMDDKIEAIKRTLTGFVDEAHRLKLTIRFGLISFGDIAVQGSSDKIEVVVPLTDNIEQVKSGIANIPHNSGYGNLGESSLEAIQLAFTLKYNPNSVKVLVLVTDEPALQNNTTPAQIIKQLTAKEFLVFTVATADQYYKDMALKNGGVWKEISATSDLSELLALFRDLVKKISEVAKNVHQIAGGSVPKYLMLNPPKKD